MRKISILFMMMAVAVLSSCNDSFLDCFPEDDINDANYWQTEDHLRNVANTFTSALGGKDILNKTEAMADSAPWAEASAYRTIGGGNYTFDNPQINGIWVGAYRAIQRTNYFLNNYKRAENVSEAIRERYAAEAYFYRAYNYWLLTSWFGDVPYITTELNVSSPDVYRGRDKREDIINSITKDLEDHYKNLPAHIDAAGPEFGRVSQTAALALLSRIFLFNERWVEAAEAAEKAMSSDYYKLYSTGNPDKDYCNLFNYTGRASRNADNHEVILAYVYNFDLGEEARKSHNLSRECQVPNDYVRFVPTQSMVECYLTKDGKIWDPDMCTSYEDIFKDRDPRMTQSILAPGTKWDGGKSGDLMNDDATLYTYPKLSNDKVGAMTYSGYYMRKYVEPSTVKFVGHDDNDIVAIRLAEVYLNYAEAKMEAGTLTQADLDKSINLLRDRVGMVHMDLSNLPVGSDIRKEIRRERRVELFFEGFRYFDLRRWKEGEILAKPLLGVRKDWIDPARIGASIFNGLNFQSIDGHEYLLIEDGRRFEPKHYLFPIPFKQTQLNKNLLPNNEGW